MFLDLKEKSAMNYGFGNAGDTIDFSQEFTLSGSKRFLVQSTGESWLWTNNSFNDYGWIENSAGDTIWSYDVPLHSPTSTNLFIPPDKIFLSQVSRTTGTLLLQIGKDSITEVFKNNNLQNDWSSSCYHERLY